MQTIISQLEETISSLLADGTADRVLGWETGEQPWERTPTLFSKEEAAGKLVYDSFCGANLSKYLIGETAPEAREGRVLVLLKPCDSYSLVQLTTEHRVNRDRVYALGVGCRGTVDPDALRRLGGKGILSVEEQGDQLVVHTLYGDRQVARGDVLLERCRCCTKTHQDCDQVVGEELTPPQARDRFSGVSRLEKMTPDQRFDFWQQELSKCIRCNACRNVCPACSCVSCVFDNEGSGVASKGGSDSFEDNMFHIIRAFHVAGRCTDCGECSRVCPQKIPLHLLNRKLIWDMDRLYGQYEAGTGGERNPLISYTMEDVEPGQALTERGAGV